jgi:electron transfer flavoprotein alpha subunit
MNISEYKGIFVFAEQRDRKVQKVAYELIGKAKELAKDLNTSVTALLLGHNMKDEAKKLCYAGADKVIYADHELLDEYMTEPYTYTLHKIITERKPEIANELGLTNYEQIDKGNLTARQNGYVGGYMTKRLVEMAQRQMSGGGQFK